MPRYEFEAVVAHFEVLFDWLKRGWNVGVTRTGAILDLPPTLARHMAAIVFTYPTWAGLALKGREPDRGEWDKLIGALEELQLRVPDRPTAGAVDSASGAGSASAAGAPAAPSADAFSRAKLVARVVKGRLEARLVEKAAAWLADSERVISTEQLQQLAADATGLSVDELRQEGTASLDALCPPISATDRASRRYAAAAAALDAALAGAANAEATRFGSWARGGAAAEPDGCLRVDLGDLTDRDSVGSPATADNEGPAEVGDLMDLSLCDAPSFGCDDVDEAASRCIRFLLKYCTTRRALSSPDATKYPKMILLRGFQLLFDGGFNEGQSADIMRHVLASLGLTKEPRGAHRGQEGTEELEVAEDAENTDEPRDPGTWGTHLPQVETVVKHYRTVVKNLDLIPWARPDELRWTPDERHRYYSRLADELAATSATLDVPGVVLLKSSKRTNGKSV
jgi:hypothetical protein